MNNKIAHLNMIQTVIGRFSKYSFTIKSWNLTILTGFYVFIFNGVNQLGWILLIIPLGFTLIFLMLDCYYLMLEKSYRNLYRTVSQILESDVDFTMELVVKEDKGHSIVASKIYGLKSVPNILFYLGEFLLIIIVSIFII